MGNGSYLPVLILLITSVCAQQQEANLDKKEVNEPVGGRVIRNGMDLQLEGTGERFVTFGTSSWKAMQSTLDDDGGFERDMDEAQRIGMTSVRILATSEGEVYSMPSLQACPRPHIPKDITSQSPSSITLHHVCIGDCNVRSLVRVSTTKRHFKLLTRPSLLLTNVTSALSSYSPTTGPQPGEPFQVVIA